MLNFVYWPISAIMWFWREALGLVMDKDLGITWALSIILLVFTVRGLLFFPSLKQMRSMRKMQKIAPQMKELQRKYKNDPMKLNQERKAIQQKEGVSTLAGCVPMLVQIPVFFGLFHVLRMFNRTGTGRGQLGLSFEQNRETANYMFSATDVQSFLDARLFGAPLSGYLSMGSEMYPAFSANGDVDFTRTDIALVTVPLMVFSAFAIHMNARISIARQKNRKAAGLVPAPAADDMMAQQQEAMTGMMNKMMLWFMPLMILATGFLWHVGLLVYMTTSNIWTYFQQKIIFGIVDREEVEEAEAEKTQAREARQKLAPKPGVRPNNPKKASRAERKKSAIEQLRESKEHKDQPES
ncbi:membrane protein insertase YidC [Corynebacterium ulceribovis]|uniref:membrane protein insertase YidC n=1 Tax=Corynebacterium ulceribovis TaxID=487732 RepID=UPI00036BF044|nr:membrane protein insertase YidC [Corynebacterium ulceribovis]